MGSFYLSAVVHHAAPNVCTHTPGLTWKWKGRSTLVTSLLLSPLGAFPEPGSGQVFVTSENQLVYYPSITYAIIGSSVIFVLVVALLALVLHHQRKRNNLMTLPVHRLQHPVLLSRLVVLDHPHHCNVTYNVNNGIQYVASQAEQNASEVGSPPSYSEALLDQRCVLAGRGGGWGARALRGGECVHAGFLGLPKGLHSASLGGSSVLQSLSPCKTIHIYGGGPKTTRNYLLEGGPL